MVRHCDGVFETGDINLNCAHVMGFTVEDMKEEPAPAPVEDDCNS